MNPYLGYGNIVTGERLVGRENELRHICERLGAGAGSISLIGEPRVGKSSLIHAVSEQLRSRGGMLVVEMDTSTISTPIDLFECIVDGIMDVADRCNYSPPTDVVEMSHKHPSSSYEAYRRCSQVLMGIQRSGMRQIVVFDEFDWISKIPEAGLTIQRLRDLIYRQYETGFAAAFVSRRSLRNLEQQIADVSTLDNVCEQYCVRPLDKKGLNKIVRRSESEWLMSDTEISKLWWYCGGHPWIAEMVLCHALPSKSVKGGAEEIMASILEHYQRLRRLLGEDELFDQLLQLTVGPQWSVKIESTEILKRYGLIRGTNDGGNTRWEAWSAHCQIYLEMCAREEPTWALWSETERGLREAIQRVCEGKCGAKWLQVIVSKHSAIANVIKGCEEKRNRELKSFGVSSCVSILDYSYPMDLWTIMSNEWEWFREILGKDRRYWNDRFSQLTKVRNPTAHSREAAVPNHEVVLAHAYCKEILAALRTTLSHAPITV